MANYVFTVWCCTLRALTISHEWVIALEVGSLMADMLQDTVQDTVGGPANAQAHTSYWNINCQNTVFLPETARWKYPHPSGA